MEEVGAVFLGTYEPKLDEKGRLILPAKFRDQLQRGLVITRGQERCLFVFTMEEFEDFQTKIHQAPLTSREARDYQRVLFSGPPAPSADEPDHGSTPPRPGAPSGARPSPAARPRRERGRRQN